MISQDYPTWGLPQKLRFTLGYAVDKFTVFRHIQSPRWSFWAYELRYSMTNAYHTLVGGTGRALWHQSEQIKTSEGSFQVRLHSQDASLISPAFEKADVQHLLSLLAKASTPVLFIDIGANIGRYTVTVGRAHSHVQIWAFEPEGDNFKLLQQNYRLNNLKLPQVQLFNVALGEKVESLDLWGHPLRAGDHSLQELEGFKKIAKVSVKPLKPWLDHVSPDTTLFIKLDVEGFEIPVLRGAGPLKERFRTVHLLVEDMQNRREIYHMLKDLGAQPQCKLTPYNSWWKIENH